MSQLDVVAQKPWEIPLIGDTCTNFKGVARTVIRREDSEGRPSNRGWFIVYHLNSGREARCYINTWTEWCRVAVRGGGSYKRLDEV